MNKRILFAIRQTILTSATIHLVLLGILALRDQSIQYLNFFDILDFEFFVPGIEQGIVSQISSVGVIVALLSFWYYYSSKAK